MASATPAAAEPSTAAIPQVAVDQEVQSEADSAYESELASYTTSLASGVTDYKQENGRRYHAFRDGAYYFPNDEKEMDRLDITHKMLETAFDGKLYQSPLKDPERILDLGTGTGIWAMEIGDRFEKCEIIGNDLSPIQPRWVPPNVRFEVDDVEADWTYSSPFDMIHCRCLYSSIKDWQRLVRQSYEHLKPGGWCEFVDVDLQWRSPDESLKGTMGEKVNRIFMDSCNAAGLDPCPGKSLEKWIKEAGFEEVRVKVEVIAFGTWPVEKKLKEVGAWNYLQTMEGMESFFMAVFTRMLSYKKEEVDVMCAQVRNNLKDPKFHAYFLIYNVIGRKPGAKAKEDAPAQGATAAPAETAAPAAAGSKTTETTATGSKAAEAPASGSAAAGSSK